MRTIVVLGTGTGIGKTYATCQLAAALIGHWAESRVLALKPIETGVKAIDHTDAEKLGASSVPRQRAQHAYLFEPAISPHLAARLHGTAIDLSRIVEWTTSRYQRTCSRVGSSASQPRDETHDWVLLETAGGTLSPLNQVHTNLDVALALEPCFWVLVGVDRLGVLHDMRATLLAMASLARTPDMILLNAAGTPDASTGTNRQEIEDLGWAQVTGQIAWNGSFDESDRRKVLEKLTNWARSQEPG
jgi:dethiobiotin synthetase